MPNLHQRSRTLRRKHIHTPGGRNVIHYVKRKPSKPQCAHCGNVLQGVARVRANQLRTIAKTQKRPQRPYGGVLCSPCMRKHIIAQTRGGAQ